jgi:uncharacterized protein (TIGR02145 family)
MKNLLFFLFLAGFITSCLETATSPDPDKGPLDKLLKIQMTNGDVIYASPVVNSPAVQWGGYKTNITALTDIPLSATARLDFSGKANTDAIVAQLGANGGTAYAAKVCADLVAYGFDDWYLPAAGELDEMYKKLGTVAQGGNGQITTGSYWSSSERNSNEGYVVYADKGLTTDFKDYESKCLCIRRELSSPLDIPSTTIGKQVWMTKNLNVDKFRNGDPILEAKTAKEWTTAGENGVPAWCYYNNDQANGEKYGKLYNWPAVNDPRGLAPKGWHLPSDEEWTTLVATLGGESLAGGKMKAAGTFNWKTTNTGVDNSSGWTGLPGGWRNGVATFEAISMGAMWWSSDYAWLYNLWHDGISISKRDYYAKILGASVRCLRD